VGARRPFCQDQRAVVGDLSAVNGEADSLKALDYGHQFAVVIRYCVIKPSALRSEGRRGIVLSLVSRDCLVLRAVWIGFASGRIRLPIFTHSYHQQSVFCWIESFSDWRWVRGCAAAAWPKTN
jgi:hypothetical protein